MKNLDKIKNQIIEVGRRLYQKNYVAANNGNLSCRIDKKRILITPSGVNKGFMQADDLLITDREGRVLQGTLQPSSEIKLHLLIYKNREDVQSVCHAHSAYATAFACSQKSINCPILSDEIISLGKIAEVEYAPPGSQQLADNLLPWIKEHDAFLLENHGAVTTGETMTSAYYKMETLEHFARINYLVQQLGSAKTLNKEQISELLALRQQFNVSGNLNKFE
ncbi:MAG: class II aldolase/adducin family protein [Candidatus Cloacimonetes bacterium]|nr:class II aldolase/adducin family protein [Candidatus Cloacimonadota bacterium]MBS3767447.1 class II aldolase/adducin family protein [Candidatus Cloacimonadota bacterium]